MRPTSQMNPVVEDDYRRFYMSARNKVGFAPDATRFEAYRELASSGRFSREELVAVAQFATESARVHFNVGMCGTYFQRQIEDTLRFAADILQAARSAEPVNL